VSFVYPNNKNKSFYQSKAIFTSSSLHSRSLSEKVKRNNKTPAKKVKAKPKAKKAVKAKKSSPKAKAKKK